MERKLKVAHLLASIKFSGAEVMLNMASPYFKQNDLDSTMIAVSNELGDYANILEESGYKIDQIKPESNKIKYFIGLYKFFKKNKFDIIHMHFEGAFFWYLLVIWFAGGRNIFRTVHAVYKYEGYLKFRRTLQRFIARKFFNVTFLAIGKSVSQFEKDVLSNPTTIINNWIDKSKFFPVKEQWEKIDAKMNFGIPNNNFTILSVGASNIIKNHKDIILALKIIISKDIKDIHYLHVGDGELQDNLKEMVKYYELDNYVTFAGQLKNVRNALVASDLFVMSSTHEGFGNSLLEALTFGLPAVVYNVSGLKDLVESGVNGFKVSPNPDELAEAILSLKKNNAGRIEMGRKARKIALEKYDMESSVNKLISLYKNRENSLVNELI